MAEKQEHGSDDVSPLAQALGCIPSGLFALTAGAGDEQHAFLASFVQQLSFRPPLIAVAVNKDRQHLPLVRKLEEFVLHPLAASDNKVIKRFWSGVPDGKDPFENFNYSHTEKGVVILSDTLAYIQCKIIEEKDIGGDHLLFIAEAVAGDKRKRDAPATHFRRDGFDY